MKVITFSAIKGGVGKSSLAILTANLLAKTGKRILVIDADPQNSMTFYYIPDTTDYKTTTLGNFANVLNNSVIDDNIVSIKGIDNLSIIPSSLELLTCKDISLNILKDKLVNLNYDYCIIDTAPTFDNLTLAVLNASDIIITPIHFSGFDYKSAVFYENLLKDLNFYDKWKLLINRFKSLKIGGSLAAEYLSLFTNTFSNKILSARIPESSIIRQYIDTGIKISPAKNKINVFESLISLKKEITGDKTIPISF